MTLTPAQKLQVLSMRFYSHLKWEPKKGDLYTTSRADNEVYQIVDIRDGKVFTTYTYPGSSTISDWPEEGFTTLGFGPCRVWIHPCIADEIRHT